MGSSSLSTRNLSKADLGGVIFGCTHDTMQECLSKQLFGLPGQHFSYVQNIEPGISLFLFNYSDRKLYGIFEAVGHGQWNIDPYGWSADGSERTKYPAQVHIRMRMQCEPLLEKQFKPIIATNYYTPSRFCFELDVSQARALTSLFGSSPHVPAKWIPKVTSSRDAAPEIKDSTQSALIPAFSFLGHLPSTKPSDTPICAQNKKLETHTDSADVEDEENIVYQKLKKLAVERNRANASATDCDTVADGSCVNNEKLEDSAPETLAGSSDKQDDISRTDSESVILQLTQRMKELKAFSEEQHQKTSLMEKKMIESKLEIQRLKDRVQLLESQLNLADDTLTNAFGGPCSSGDVMFLLGGYDGHSLLSSLDSYSPSEDSLRQLRPMSAIRSHAAAAALNGQIYIFGGRNGNLWYDTVEAYNPSNDEWNLCPSLNGKKANLAGAALRGKLFAVGGGDENHCLSDVEMLDPSLGWWVHAPAMLQKRFAPASTTLNGALYAVGGYDGDSYLKSAERFDPRSTSWEYLPSMKTRRGCHCLVAFNEKLFAFGGHDGTGMVSSVEILDPRFGSWTDGAPMNLSRGYAGAVVIGESIYVIGGVEFETAPIVLDIVERYKEDTGWLVTNSEAIGKRCFFSTVVL